MLNAELFKCTILKESRTEAEIEPGKLVNQAKRVERIERSDAPLHSFRLALPASTVRSDLLALD